MNYIENIYICLSAPLLIAVLCTRSTGRVMMLFVLAGMTTCLLSSYISTFIAAVYAIDHVSAAVCIAPIVEETMKLLPILFYLLVFEPPVSRIPSAMIATATGFATFENVCYLTSNGTSHLFDLLIRGFGTGVMHVFCGIIIFIGLSVLWDKRWLRATGTFGLLGAVMTYHGIYNMLVLQPEGAAYIGYLIPLVSIVLYFLLYRRPQNPL